MKQCGADARLENGEQLVQARHAEQPAQAGQVHHARPALAETHLRLDESFHRVGNMEVLATGDMTISSGGPA